MSEDFLDAVKKYGMKGKPEGWNHEGLDKIREDECNLFICSKCGKQTDWISWDFRDLCLECYLKN